MNRKDSEDKEEKKEEEEKEEEDNILVINPSISSNKIIPKIFIIISAVIG
jgi:hypothetical protein